MTRAERSTCATSLATGWLALLLCPPLFGLAAFVIGIVNCCDPRTSRAGLAQIALSIFATILGMALGMAVWEATHRR